MKRMHAKYPGKCGECGGKIAAGSQMDYDRHAPRGLKAFHADCNDTDPNPDTANRPRRGEDGALYFAGDARPVAMTRNGWRHGYEHTGRRCEDAPCCGCC